MRPYGAKRNPNNYKTPAASRKGKERPHDLGGEMSVTDTVIRGKAAARAKDRELTRKARNEEE